MNLRRLFLRLLPLTAMTLLLTACDRRPLEVYYYDEARLMLHVDWMSEFGTRPQGMTVHVYNDAGDLCRAFSTNSVDSVPLSLEVGAYRVVVFNGDVNQFPSFGFEGAERFDDFRAVARLNTQRSSLQAWDLGARYTWEPDELLGAAVDSFEVVDDLTTHDLKFVSYHRRHDAHGHRTDYHEYVTVRPLQTMLHMRIHVNGMENMYRLESSLDGMADGCSMSYTWRNTTTSAVFYDSNVWGYTFDGEASKHGWVSIDIPTWGEPHGKELVEQRDSTDNVLRMNFTLRNGEERYFEFNVGHLIVYHQPQADPARLTPPDVLRHLYLVINREIPLLPDVPYDHDMGAGFTATVDPWDYGGEIDLGTF